MMECDFCGEDLVSLHTCSEPEGIRPDKYCAACKTEFICYKEGMSVSWSHDTEVKFAVKSYVRSTMKNIRFAINMVFGMKDYSPPSPPEVAEWIVSAIEDDVSKFVK